MSRNMSNSWANALKASKTLLGRCEIAVINSQTTSVGLAMLVEAAAQMAETGADLDDIVRMVRAMIGHVYTVFYVDKLDYLRHNGLLSEAQTILGTMLDIKPFLTIEEGELVPMEKVRTRRYETVNGFVVTNRFRVICTLGGHVFNTAPSRSENIVSGGGSSAMIAVS